MFSILEEFELETVRFTGDILCYTACVFNWDFTRWNIFSIEFISGERAWLLGIFASTWARDAIATLLVWHGQYALCIMISQGLMPARNAGLCSYRPGKLNNSKRPPSKFSWLMTTKTTIPRGHQALWRIMHKVYYPLHITV